MVRPERGAYARRCNRRRCGGSVFLQALLSEVAIHELAPLHKWERKGLLAVGGLAGGSRVKMIIDARKATYCDLNLSFYFSCFIPTENTDVAIMP